MARLTDAVLCVLAIALVGLGAREVAPFLRSPGTGGTVPALSAVARALSRTAPFGGRDRNTTYLALEAPQRCLVRHLERLTHGM